MPTFKAPQRQGRQEHKPESAPEASPEVTAPAASTNGDHAEPGKDLNAPFGRDAEGIAFAPHGLLPDGKPRQHAQVKTDIPELELDALGDFVAPPPMAQTAPVQERSDRQKHIDALVNKLHTTWITRGEPRTWDDMLKQGTVGGFWVAPSAVEGLKRLVDRAARFHNVSIRYGSLVNRQPGMPDDGKIYLPFAARTTSRRGPRKPKASA